MDYYREINDNIITATMLLCGRQIYVERLHPNEHKLCTDCSEPAIFRIKELDNKIWYYCGICALGG